MSTEDDVKVLLYFLPSQIFGIFESFSIELHVRFACILNFFKAEWWKRPLWLLFVGRKRSLTRSFHCWKRLILGILPLLLLNLAKNGGCYLQLSTDSFFSCCKHYCKIQMGVHCIIVVRRFFLLLEKVKLPFFVH